MASSIPCAGIIRIRYRRSAALAALSAWLTQAPVRTKNEYGIVLGHFSTREVNGKVGQRRRVSNCRTFAAAVDAETAFAKNKAAGDL